jgi:hypothetical protein
MEKVRKAEVPPPSKFNRRVPEALDKICIKALARDVQDRYQTAAEFSAELMTVLGNYRFDTSELREQVRSLFRADFTKEQAEMQACLKAVQSTSRPPDPPRSMSSSGVGAIADDANTAQVQMPPVPVEPPPQPAAGPGRASLWDKLRSKLKK